MNVVVVDPYPNVALQWRHNEREGVSNHQPHDCLFKAQKTSKFRVTGLCERNSPVTMFPFDDVIKDGGLA